MQVLKGMALGLLGLFLFICVLSLGIGFTINNTALNPEFIQNEINKLDIPGAAHDAIGDYVLPNYKPYLSGFDQAMTDSMPWINSQISYVVNGTYDYLLGKTDRLNLSFSTLPFQLSLKQDVTAAFLKSPPTGYNQLSAADKQTYLTRFQQDLVADIPAQIDINATSLGADAMNTLAQARSIAGDLKTAYSTLIAVTLVLVFLIVWLLRDVAWTLRALGLICFVAGALSSIVVFGLKSAAPDLLPLEGLPAQLQTWIPAVINDFMSPWMIFGLSFLIGGAVLFIASFFFRRSQAMVEDSLAG
jgi:hypothetical protein